MTTLLDTKNLTKRFVKDDVATVALRDFDLMSTKAASCPSSVAADAASPRF